MSLPLIVPDASVMLKWALRGPDELDGDRALALLREWLSGACAFLLPPLWVYEVGNVLGLKCGARAAEFMAIFLGYRFPECLMTDDLCSRTLDLMREYGVTFYDAVYHAVAMAHGGRLITADAAYCAKAHAAGCIMLLDAFEGAGS